MMTRNSLPSLATLVLVVLVMLALFIKNPAGGGGCNLPSMPGKSTSPTGPTTDPATGEAIETPVENNVETARPAPKPVAFTGKVDAATMRRVAAEALWTELAEAFQKGSDGPAQAVVEGTDWAAFGLPADEIAFYKSLRSLLNRDGQDYSGDDWLRRFRSAGYVYGEVEAVFERVAPGSAASPDRATGNPASLDRLEKAMQSQFSIEPEKTEGFLRKYPQAGPGKWATLVFYLQN